MDFQHYVALIVEFVKTHQTWAAPIVFALAFGESLAFLSLLLPASVILLGIGGLMGASNIPFIPVCIAAAVGSIVGYGISYYIGLHFKDDIQKLWPFSRYPEMIPRGRSFFEKWGALGVFMGHFFGPVRAVIPVVAGMYELKPLHFWAANIASSCLWAFGILAPGALGLRWFGFLGG
jgi:membrane protein DedA with SNARE-associated domain